jgi:hypothetical protein
MTEETNYPNEIQRFYYDDLKWCGCGNPDEALGFMRDVLEVMNLRSNENGAESHSVAHEESAWMRRTRELYAMLGDGMLGLSYLYVLDAHGLTEHGGSIGGSWLTHKGERVLALLKSRDLDAAMSEDYA